jgi:hypothetical protein
LKIFDQIWSSADFCGFEQRTASQVDLSILCAEQNLVGHVRAANGLVEASPCSLDAIGIESLLGD